MKYATPADVDARIRAALEAMRVRHDGDGDDDEIIYRRDVARALATLAPQEAARCERFVCDGSSPGRKAQGWRRDGEKACSQWNHFCECGVSYSAHPRPEAQPAKGGDATSAIPTSSEDHTVDAAPAATVAGAQPAAGLEAPDAFSALAADVVAWGTATFPQSSDASRVEHLAREVEELRQAPADPTEMADVLLILMHQAGAHGVDLIAQARSKFEIAKRRTWGKPDAQGVVEHVRSQPAAGLASEPIEPERPDTIRAELPGHPGQYSVVYLADYNAMRDYAHALAGTIEALRNTAAVNAELARSAEERLRAAQERADAAERGRDAIKRDHDLLEQEYRAMRDERDEARAAAFAEVMAELKDIADEQQRRADRQIEIGGDGKAYTERADIVRLLVTHTVEALAKRGAK